MTSICTQADVSARLRGRLASSFLPRTVVEVPSVGIPAAVLVLVRAGKEAGVLLTLRAAALRTHAGEVSFPGGRMDPSDRDAETAALREAGEEIGLDPCDVSLLGRLPLHRTGTGFLITPVVGILDTKARLTADPREVAAIFTLPMAVLLDPAAPARRQAHWQGQCREFWIWPHDTHHVWGATAAILLDLAHAMRDP